MIAKTSSSSSSSASTEFSDEFVSSQFSLCELYDRVDKDFGSVRLTECIYIEEIINYTRGISLTKKL
jgi:hypothetical protein